MRIKRTAVRCAAGLAGLTLLLGGGLTAGAAGGDTAVYTLTQEGNVLSMTQEESGLTFWEAPDVTTGQTRMGGVLTLKNESTYTVDFVLTDVSLPYGDEAALTYLDAVTVDIAAGDTVYYHDTVTRLMDAGRAEIRLDNVAPGETRQLTLAVSCAYTYTGQAPAYSSLVWTFSPQVADAAPTVSEGNNPASSSSSVNWKLLGTAAAGLAAAVLVTAAICVVIRRRRRR